MRWPTIRLPLRRVHRRSGVPVLCCPREAGALAACCPENGVAAHVFTPSRIELLTLLVSQAAICSRTHLYADLNETQAYHGGA
jgi:hypothetical protein